MSGDRVLRVSFLEAMLGEIRDGFAAIRSHRTGVCGSTVELERRLDELEQSVACVKVRLQLSEPDERS